MRKRENRNSWQEVCNVFEIPEERQVTNGWLDHNRDLAYDPIYLVFTDSWELSDAQ